MITILYAALAGIGIVLTAEVVPHIHAKPGNWDKEMKEYSCNSIRLRPRIGADEVTCVKIPANIAKKP